MVYRALGRTGVQVSQLCLGTMTFGWDPHDWGSTEEESRRVFDRALELGINFFDTANIYARGISEEYLGKFVRGHRDKLVIATKCHGRMDDHDPNAMGNSRRHILQACEDSLRRLGTDYIDLYQIHRPQPEIPIDETLRALDDLVRQGKVRYLGASTFAAWQVCEATYVARSLGTATFVTEQPPYNLLDRRIERELLPFCRTYDLGVIPWSPLAGGQLTGKYLEGASNGRYAKTDPQGRVNERTTAVVQKLKDLADQAGMTLTRLSMAWITHQPGITSPIIGARQPEQLTELAMAAETPLPDDLLAKIDEAVPPGSHVANYYTANFGPGTRPFI